MAFIIHVTIQLFLKYLDYKHKYPEYSMSSTFESKAFSVQSKNTVSLGSALFFVLILIAGLLSRSVSRSIKLFYLMPLQITAMTLFFPLVIIFKNPKLKQKFLQSLPWPIALYYKCFSRNTIVPII